MRNNYPMPSMTNNIIKHLNKLYPVIIHDGDRCIDLGHNTFGDVMGFMGITTTEFIDWIFSNFPNGKYCVLMNGGKFWYWGFKEHRDNNLPAIIHKGYIEYFIDGVRVDKNGEPHPRKLRMPRVNRMFV